MAKRKSSKRLKSQVRPTLIFVLMANLAVAAFVFAHGALPTSLQQAQDLLIAVLPAGLGLAIFGAANELLSPETKARLVFWRWRDPLPGSEAFTRYGPHDARVDVAAIERKLGTSPRDPTDQNRTWYALYKTVQDEPQVVDAHKSFLFLRDWAGLAAMIAIGLPALSALTGRLLAEPMAFYVGGLILQYLAVRWGAANAGRRFVTNAMACYMEATPKKASKAKASPPTAK